MKSSVFLMAGLSLAASASAHSFNSPHSSSSSPMGSASKGIYIGVDGGLAQTPFDASPGVDSSSSKTRTSFLRAALGYHFTPNFALEGGYFRSGDFKRTETRGEYTDHAKADINGFDFAAVYTFDLGLYIKGGVTLAKLSESAVSQRGQSEVGRYTYSKSGMGYLLGLGYRFDVTPKLSIDVGYTRLQKVANTPVDVNVNVLTGGLRYRF